MKKNSAKRATRADALQVVKGRVFSGVSALPIDTPGSPDPFIEELIESATSNRSFDTKEQAIDFFINSICTKLGDQPGEESSEQSEMKDFLRLLVDTDPAFGEELVRGIAVRK